MMVNNPLQLYAVVIGCKLYQSLFQIFMGFGLVFIPLVVTFANALLTLFEQGLEGGASSAKGQVSLGLLVYYLGFLLFALPFYPLDVKGMLYTPVCAVKGVTPSHLGDTGTTYDKAFDTLRYEGISIPFGLALVLTGVSGITNAAMVSLPCKTDVSAISTTIDTTVLTPQLTRQITDFTNSCFLPAKTAFLHVPPNAKSYQTLQNDFGGAADMNWLGSHVFQTLYYDRLMATSPVTGFEAASYPGPYAKNNAQAGVPQGQWGYPTCNQWWNAPTVGIKAKLVTLANDHSPHNAHLGALPLSTQLSAWWQTVKPTGTKTGNRIKSEDIIAHGVLQAHHRAFGFTYTGGMNMNGAVADMTHTGYPAKMAKNIMAQAGMGIHAVENSIKRKELAMEIPIVQAIILGFLLMIGPIVVIIGGYRAKVVFPYYFLIASTLFVTFIEHVIRYFENSLHASLSYGIFALGNASMLFNVFTFFYEYAPLFFLMVMSVVGVGIGQAMHHAMGSSQSGAGGQLATRLSMKTMGGA